MTQGYEWLAGIAYAVFVTLELCFRGAEWMLYLHKVGILCGMVFCVGICARYLVNGRRKINSFLSDSSFFIFAYHAAPLAFIVKIIFATPPQSEWVLMFLFLLCPAITILLGLGIYAFLKKLFPRLTAIITGGR